MSSKYDISFLLSDPSVLKSMEDSLREFDRIKEELDTGWPPPFDALQEWFEDLYNTIVNMPHKIWDYIEEHLINPVVDWILSTGEYLGEIYKDAYDKALEEIDNYPDPWKWLVLPFAVQKHFLIDNVFKPTIDFIKGGLNSIVEGIRTALSPIIEPIQQFVERVIDFITKDVPGFFDNVRKGFEGFTDKLSKLPGFLTELFTKQLPEALFNNLQNVWKWINEEVIPPIKKAIEGAWNTIQDKFKGLLSMVFNYFRDVKDRIMRGEIFESMIEVLPLLEAGFAIAAAIDVMSIKVLGSGIDVKAIKDFLTSIIDPKMFFSIFLGVLSAESIKRPLEYWAKETFRTTIPGPGDLINFYKLDRLTKDELFHWMRKHGYSDEWIELYEYSAWELPRFYDVYVSYVRGVIPESDFNKWLNILNIKREPRPGLEVPDIEIFKEGVYKLPSPFYIVYAAETGLIPEEKIKDILRDALYHPKYLDILSKSIYARSLLSEMRLAASKVLSDYAEGVISKDEAAKLLKALGKRDEDLKILLPAFENQRTRMIRRKALSEYEKMFRKGYISKEEFINTLVQYGYDREIIERYADLLETVIMTYDLIEATKDERRSLASTYMKMFKEGLIDEETLRKRLEELGFSDTEVELRIERAKQEYAEEITDLWIKYYQELYRKGLIDADTLETSLKELGIDEARARSIRNYLEARYTEIESKDLTKDERNALASTLLKLYRYGAISRDDLARRLVELGFSDDEVNLKLERADKEYENEIREIQLDILIEQMKQGLVDRSVFVDNCVNIGYSVDKCKALAELYWTKYIGVDYYVLTKDERSSLANTYLKLYVRGLFTETEIRQKLKELGYSDREIELKIERVKLEDAWEMIDDLIKFFDEQLRQGVMTEEQYVQQLVKLGIREDRARVRAKYVLRKIIAKELIAGA